MGRVNVAASGPSAYVLRCGNFVQWVMAIYDALRAGGDTISFKNIIALYNWSSKDHKKPCYSRYVKDLLNKGIIDKVED